MTLFICCRCVLELHAIAEQREKGLGRFEIAMTATEQRRFLLGLQSRLDAYLNMLGRINAETSDYSRADDRRSIHEGIRCSVGFAKLSRMVFGVMEGWMKEQLHGQAAASAAAGDTTGNRQWNLMLSLFYRVQGKFSEAIAANNVSLDNIGDDCSSQVQSALLNLATIHGEVGRHEEALKLKEKVLKMSRRASPIDHRFLGEAFCCTCCCGFA